MTSRVRFAPSPTGSLHLGNARTALMNWLWARHTGGVFILRIEDTDRERSEPRFTRDILDSLAWLGIDWDEGPDRGGEHGPYIQSQCTDWYTEALRRLQESRHVYPCVCSESELEAQRAAQVAAGLPPRYNGRCRGMTTLDVDGKMPHAWRFRVPAGRELTFDDMVRGRVRFHSDDLGDFVVARQDGSPTYHLAVVVDDARMGITHVIRGEDHLANTPRHLLLHEALGHTAPEHAHLPMLLAPDRTKLSKRHGAPSIHELRASGYLPEAVINQLSLLGWTPPDGEEIRDVVSLIRDFGLDRVHLSGAIFDPDRMAWMNARWMKRLDPEDLLARVMPRLDGALQRLDTAHLVQAIALVQEELVTLADIGPALSWLESGPEQGCLAWADHGLDPDSSRRVCARMATDLLAFSGDASALKGHFKVLSRELELGMKAILLPVRLALTGKPHGPELARLMTCLGHAEAICRLERAAYPSGI